MRMYTQHRVAEKERSIDLNKTEGQTNIANMEFINRGDFFFLLYSIF